MTKYTIYEVKDYTEWFATQTLKSRRQVQNRLAKIQEDGHFGHINDLEEKGDGLQELKFNDGRRIYYIIIPISHVIL